MSKVIIFEKSGKIRLGNLIDDHEKICKENITDVIPCPTVVLEFAPKELLEYCKAKAPKYLYCNTEGRWKVVEDFA